MKTLRTQENSEFVAFFEIVQKEAAKLGCAYFLDCGEGHDCKTDKMELSDLSGWLIPFALADEFEKDFRNGEVPEKWDDFYKFVEWKNKNNPKIIFS